MKQSFTDYSTKLYKAVFLLFTVVSIGLLLSLRFKVISYGVDITDSLMMLIIFFIWLIALAVHFSAINLFIPRLNPIKQMILLLILSTLLVIIILYYFLEDGFRINLQLFF